MTLPALLLAAAVLTPGPQPATVPTGIRPPVSVGTANPSCGVVRFKVSAPTPTPVAGWHDIANASPTTATVGGAILTTVERTPGTVIRWGVTYFYPDDVSVAVEGTYTVPPCLSAPEPPPRVVVDDTILTPVHITRHRADLWDWILRRWGAR